MTNVVMIISSKLWIANLWEIIINYYQRSYYSAFKICVNIYSINQIQNFQDIYIKFNIYSGSIWSQWHPVCKNKLMKIDTELLLNVK